MLTPLRHKASFAQRQRPFSVTTVTSYGWVLALAMLLCASSATAQVEFSWDPEMPAISETVTFTIEDSEIIPLSWSFGGQDCQGNDQVVDCTWIPEYCRHITWSYAEAGAKTVHLVAEQGEVTHTVQVQNSGSCCTKDGKPVAAFSMSPNPSYTDQIVVFTDLSAKSSKLPKNTDVDFNFTPENPEIGETVIFQITGIGNIDSAEWDFGGDGCGNLVQEEVCEPIFTTCLTSSYIYAGAGEKSVRLTLNGGLYETIKTLSVQNEGHCDDGGGCTYHLSPASRTFGHTGGSDSVSVSAGPPCQWAATSTVNWIEIIAGQTGSGNGSVTYSVAANGGGARTGRVLVEGRMHTVHQEAYDDGTVGDTSPDSWNWSISLDGQIVATSDQQHFSHAFDMPGLYFVHLEAANCFGSDTESGVLVVEEPPTSAEGWVVPSAVHAPGLHQTRWRTDVWIFNPETSDLQVNVKFLAENTNNWLEDHPTLSLQIPPRGTAALEDVLELIPDVIEGDQAVVGSLLIESLGESAPYIASRTYNETPAGTFGQFVSSSPVPPMAADRLYLTGLAQNSQARTNIRLANLGTEPTEVTMYVLSDTGHTLGQPVIRSIPALSTIQVNGIAEISWAGTDLDLFSVRVDTNVDTVLAWASVVDNLTGDPVLYNPIALESASRTLLVPGVSHAGGANDSQWRSDITFFNPDVRPLDTEVVYIPSENLEVGPPLEIDGLQPGFALFYGDVLGHEFLPAGANSSGFFIIDGPGQGPPLQPAARTYNLDSAGGTFGQNLHIYDGTELLTPGHRAFIPGIVLSANDSDGFRTNLGLVNLDADGWTQVSLTLYDDQGAVAGQLSSLWLDAGQMSQFNIASRLGLQGVDLQGTVMIEHLAGGSVAAYASVIDNKTQDPILIPATPEIP